MQQIRQRDIATLDDRIDRRAILRLSDHLLFVPYQTSQVPDIVCTLGTALQLAGIASEPSVTPGNCLLFLRAIPRPLQGT
jgi:hypothetical protein